MNRSAPMACGPNVDHEAARDEEGLLVKHHTRRRKTAPVMLPGWSRLPRLRCPFRKTPLQVLRLGERR
jgi:hypothetical protein